MYLLTHFSAPNIPAMYTKQTRGFCVYLIDTSTWYITQYRQRGQAQFYFEISPASNCSVQYNGGIFSVCIQRNETVYFIVLLLNIWVYTFHEKELFVAIIYISLIINITTGNRVRYQITSLRYVVNVIWKVCIHYLTWGIFNWLLYWYSNLQLLGAFHRYS